MSSFAKIHKVLQTFPKESLLARLTSSLFLVSPIARKSEIFATHPHVNQRVRNIARLTSKNSLVHRNATVLHDHKVDIFMDFRIGLEPFLVLVQPGPPRFSFHICAVASFVKSSSPSAYPEAIIMSPA